MAEGSSSWRPLVLPRPDALGRPGEALPGLTFSSLQTPQLLTVVSCGRQQLQAEAYMNLQQLTGKSPGLEALP